MKINSDTMTTVIGGVMAVGEGAMPVLSVIEGTMDTQDIVRLILAVTMALFGWATNKVPKKEEVISNG